MKPWQHGIPLERLIELEQSYDDYNKHALSPFAKYKRNDIARDIHTGNFFTDISGLTYTKHIAKVKTPITMFKNVVLGYKEPGDTILAHINSPTTYALTKFLRETPGPCWVGAPYDDAFTSFSLKEASYHYVGMKITTFGEQYSIWFKQPENTVFGSRTHPYVDPIHKVVLRELNYGVYFQPYVDSIKAELLNSMPHFENHYSNYNKKKSWSAVSLFGYSKDPSFIGKPIEMSKDWKKKNPDWESWSIGLTDISDKFKSTLTVVSQLEQSGYGDVHRVRFMKLAPHEGELERHTDQVDPDSGLDIGCLARIHIPILTNLHVNFITWDSLGKQIYIPRYGQPFVLDTRWPHSVINRGETDRIHLVIDMCVTQKLKHEILS
jgi:hypothetical protein